MINNKQHKKVRELLYETDNGISPFFFGFYEKKKRKEFGYSLENVSKDLLISKGNLSEMENGLRPMKKEVFDRFLSHYHIHFNDDPARIIEIQEVLIELIDCFLRFDEKKEKNVREHWKEVQNKDENSYAIFLEKLISYFIRSGLDHQKDDSLFNALIEIGACFSNDEKALIYLVHGMEGRWHPEIGNMNNWFEKALEIADEKEIYGLKALIGYYHVIELMRIKCSFEVYEQCINIRKQFYIMHNYIRALYMDNLEAVCVSRLRAYDSASLRFETLLHNMEYVNDPYLRFCVVQNMIIVLCVKGEYQKALDLMKRERAGFQFGLSNFVFAPLCLYMLDEKRHAQKILADIKPYIKAKDDAFLCILVEAALTTDSELVLKTMSEVIQENRSNQNHQGEEIVYQFMIHYCKAAGLDQRRMEIQEQYIACLTR